MSRKDVEQLVRRLRREGAEVERTGTDHWRARNPETGGVVVFAGTPGGGNRSLANTVADLRRVGLLRRRTG